MLEFSIGIIIGILIETLILWLTSKFLVGLEKATCVKAFGVSAVILLLAFATNFITADILIRSILQLAVETILVKQLFDTIWGRALTTAVVHYIVSLVVGFLMAYLIMLI